MTNIHVRVQGKIAICRNRYLISSNSNYRVIFDFDKEWEDSYVKTARLFFNSQYLDLMFLGASLDLPKIPACENFSIGVFTDTLATTKAHIGCIISVADSDGEPVSEFTQSQYDQIVALLNEADLRRIESVSRQGNRIVFTYNDLRTDEIPIYDGVSVSAATVDGNGNLILTLSNSRTINAGSVKGKPFTFSDFTAEQLAELKGTQGKSAYEIALDNGFSGTEEEWLESLNGNITAYYDTLGDISSLLDNINGEVI